jgi:hypothetical protein
MSELECDRKKKRSNWAPRGYKSASEAQGVLNPTILVF